MGAAWSIWHMVVGQSQILGATKPLGMHNPRFGGRETGETPATSKALDVLHSMGQRWGSPAPSRMTKSGTMGWQDLWGCASAGLGIQVPSLPCQGVAALPSWDTPSQAYPPRQALDDGVPGSPAAVPALGVVEDQGGRQGEETQEWATRALVGNQARRSPKAAVKDTNSWRGPSCTHREVLANQHIDGQMMAVVATCFWDPSSPWQPRAAGEEATQGVKKSTELVWAETPQRFGAKGHPAACQSLPDISPMFLKAFPFFFFFYPFVILKRK